MHIVHIHRFSLTLHLHLSMWKSYQYATTCSQLFTNLYSYPCEIVLQYMTCYQVTVQGCKCSQWSWTDETKEYICSAYNFIPPAGIYMTTWSAYLYMLLLRPRMSILQSRHHRDECKYWKRQARCGATHSWRFLRDANTVWIGAFPCTCSPA